MKLISHKLFSKKLVEKVIENAKIYDKKLIADCSYAKRIIERK